jgi:hypothetical protein
MARFRLVPERSSLAIEARSNVGPIRWEATGLQGGAPEALLHLLPRGGLALPPSARIHSLGRPRFIGSGPVHR